MKLTKFEQEMLDELQRHRSLQWLDVAMQEVKALNRLVKKGLAAHRNGNDHYSGWISVPINQDVEAEK
jgi:desulfoferrodoxin (superoxide reductase-like protein)